MPVDHKAVAEKLIAARRKKFTVEEYVELADAVANAGGQMVQASFDDGDWCGTGRLPFPPKNFDKVLEVVAKLGGGGRIIINGITGPVDFDLVVTPDRVR